MSVMEQIKSLAIQPRRRENVWKETRVVEAGEVGKSLGSLAKERTREIKEGKGELEELLKGETKLRLPQPNWDLRVTDGYPSSTSP